MCAGPNNQRPPLNSDTAGLGVHTHTHIPPFHADPAGNGACTHVVSEEPRCGLAALKRAHTRMHHQNAGLTMHTAGTQRLDDHSHSLLLKQDRRDTGAEAPTSKTPFLLPRELLQSCRTDPHTAAVTAGHGKARTGGAGRRTAPGLGTDRQATVSHARNHPDCATSKRPRQPGHSYTSQSPTRKEGCSHLRQRRPGSRPQLAASFGKGAPHTRGRASRAPRASCGCRRLALGPLDLAPQPRPAPVLPANRNWAQTLAIA